VGGDAVDAPIDQLTRTMRIIDRPGDDEEAAARELPDYRFGKQGVAAGDPARAGIAVGDGTEEIEFGRDIDGVERLDGGEVEGERAEGAPLLGGGDEARGCGSGSHCLFKSGDGFDAAVLEIEEDTGGTAGDGGKEFGETVVGVGDTAEVPTLDEEREEADAALVAGLKAAAVEPEIDFEEIGAGGDEAAGAIEGVAAAMRDDGRTLAAGGQVFGFAGGGLRH